MDVKGAIERLIEKQSKMTIIAGKVNAVDSEAKTCSIEPLDGSAPIMNVRLRATIDNTDEGIVCVPKVDSYIIAGFIQGNMCDASVLQYSEIETIEIKIGSTTLNISSDGIIVNEGNLNGLVILDELKSRLSTIETAFNNFLTEYKAHQHSTTCGAGAGIATTFIIPSTQNSMNLGDLNNLENTKIKQ